MFSMISGRNGQQRRRNENGNVFIAIFGAIAMIGILGATVMTFMKGPLSTSVKLTKMNTAENQMAIGAQVAVMASASQPNNGDCETAPDGYVEPLAWRSPTIEPVPTGGGLVPLTIGVSKKDPWGTEYGYCAWNHGPTTTGAGCGANMLAGTNSRTYPVVSLVSAGPDKTFTTTCRTFAAADVNSDGDLLDVVDLPMVSKAVETDDDVITTYTYEEATGVSGGLWSIKSGSPGTAVIGKNIETTGKASFAGGVLLPDKAFITCNDITNAGVMAKSAAGIEICDGAGNWTTIGGGSSSAFATAATCTVPADAGKVRYNPITSLPEFCDGTGWRPFTLASQVANLVLTPSNQNAMDVDGGNNLDLTNCTVPSGLSCGAITIFTLQNQGGAASATVNVSMTNATNFVKVADTCDGTTLAVMGSCAISIRPKSDGNTTYTGNLQITANNNPFAMMQGTAINFGCFPGRLGPGGRYAGCGIADPDGSYNLVIIPSGCSGSTTNPSCSGNDGGGIGRSYGAENIQLPNVGAPAASFGARQHQNLITYRIMTSIVMPAAQYCDDMVYGGYSDWFLPSTVEWNYVNTAYNAGQLSGFTYAGYKLSDQHPDYAWGLAYEWVPGQGYGTFWRNSVQYVRCVRRDNLPLPSATVDVDPDVVSISPAIILSPSAVGTSGTVTISGIMQTISASMTGGTGMDIIKNGVSTGSSSISGLKIGDTLAFRMNGPATMGTKSTATITIGTDTYPWWVGYADSSKTLKVFVTSTQYNPNNLGGLGGGDSKCNALASSSPYGLSSSWRMIGSDRSISAADRIPWSWGTAVNLNGDVVVDNGFNDLFDGTLDNPILFDEQGNQRTDSVWTGSESGGSRDGSVSNCNYFLSWPYYTEYTQIGYANSASSTWISAGQNNCGDNRRIYCIENISAALDTNPNDMSPAYAIQVPPSSRQVSTLAVSGMSNGATQTLTVSGAGGTPTFKINGGAEVTTGTIQNGDSIQFLMDAPAVASSNNMMTITAGSMNSRWRIWSGASGTVVKRVFVTSTDPQGNTFGGVTGGDPICQSRATAAGLGGTWKAILSGIVEAEWAINRVGYNWSELRLVDNTTVVAYAGGLWSTLLSPIIQTEFGATRGSTRVLSGTASNGKSYSSVSDLSNFYNWTGAACSETYMQGNSSSLSAAITQGYWLCQYDGALYCIEQ